MRLLHAGVVAGLTVAVLGFAAVARADSQALLNEIVEVYVNATPGQVFETQRRGGITLGSVVARSRIVRPNFISMTPMSIRGGCQGFDLVGGSFSFINGEQLQQYLRSIASNALNYAFTLALEGVCPTCMQKMEKLRDWSDAMNEKLMDSCHWASSLVNATGIDDWHKSRMERARNREVQLGVVDDAFEALDTFVSEFQTDTDTGEPTPVNAVWHAMQRSQTASWFGSIGDGELQEIIMSVTGSVIKSPLDQNGAQCQNTDAAREYCFRELVSLLSVEHFTNGSDGGPLSVYQCRDGHVECLEPIIVQRQWPGLKRRIREILFGPAPGFTGGLVFKLRNPADAYTDAERRFIEGAPLPVYTLLKNVAQFEGALVTMGEQLQEQITAQLARRLVLELISVVQKSFGASSVQMSGVMKEKLKERTAEFQARLTYEDRQFDNLYKLLQIMDQITRHVRQQQPATTSNVPATRPKT
jgi:conjugative transfer pilus assembly protein TraH